MLIDAAGNEIATDRCACGRHMTMRREGRCCAGCPANGGDGIHSTACNMIQEHFPDTRRGVLFTEVHGRLLPSGSLPVARVERVR